MRYFTRCFMISAIAITTSLPAFAATRNTGGEDAAPTLGRHVLSPQLSGTGVNILYAPSEDDDATLRADIAAITGGTVDYFDARAATPDAGTLALYSCVMTWTNEPYLDRVAFGDNLAAFVDNGGTVVLGAFATFTSGNSLGGAIMGAGYSPVTSPSGNNHYSNSAYAGDGTTILHDGVAAYDATFRDVLQLQGGGLQDGSYLDGEIALAYRPDYRVVYANGAGGNPVRGGGDWAQIIANACSASAVVAPREAMRVVGQARFNHEQQDFLDAFCAAPPSRDNPDFYAELCASPSDARLKTDIVRVGMTDNGLPWYRFRYIGEQQVYEGVMAQDVLLHTPEAVIERSDGYLAVNYHMLGLRMKAVQ